MKKIIILGFFLIMTLLSLFIGKATVYGKMDDVNLKTREIERKLTDKEIIDLKIVTSPDKKYVHRCIVNEYRTKKRFGWETKIDTTSSDIIELKN